MLFHAQEVKSGCLCVPSGGEIKGSDSWPYCNDVSWKEVNDILDTVSQVDKLDLSPIFTPKLNYQHQPDNPSVLDKLDFLSDTYLVLRWPKQ